MESKYTLYSFVGPDLSFMALHAYVMQGLLAKIADFQCSDSFIGRMAFNESDLAINGLRYCICYCTPNLDRNQLDSIEKIKRFRIPILPVIDIRSQNAMEDLPECLRDINALAVDVKEPEWSVQRILQHILEGFGLIREERRVFISYKRSESRLIALQIHDALIHNGYSVFLDTASIRSGAVFQKDLMHQLADSDILIFLNSDNASDSSWVRDEYMNASAQRIGILHIDWPDAEIPDNLSAAVNMVKPYKLVSSDFTVHCPLLGRLTEEAIRRIMYEVECLRISNLSARRTLMINEFCDHLRSLGNDLNIRYSPVDNLIVVVNEEAMIQEGLYYPITGFPKSSVFDKVRKNFELTADSDKDISILYNKMLIHDETAAYLKWIDGNTPIHLTGFDGFSKEA